MRFRGSCVVVAVAACWAGPLLAASATAPAECSRVKCHEPGKITVSGPGRTFEIEKSATPFVVRGEAVSLYPGEAVTVTFAAGESSPGAISFLSVEAARIQAGGGGEALTSPIPKNAMRFSVSELDKNGGTLMIIENTLPDGVKFDVRAHFPPMNADQLRYTSSCPIQPRTIGYETWGDAMGEIVVSNFRYAEGAEQTTCQ